MIRFGHIFAQLSKMFATTMLIAVGLTIVAWGGYLFFSLFGWWSILIWMCAAMFLRGVWELADWPKESL